MTSLLSALIYAACAAGLLYALTKIYAPVKEAAAAEMERNKAIARYYHAVSREVEDSRAH